jgi:regulator of sirC expression with transglutaminase-like and TPR domain
MGVALDEFAQLIARDDARIDLARACLMIAQDAYPELDVERYLGEIERMALALRGTLGKADAPGDSPEERVMALNRFLFAELGYRGNAEEYYDPRNSYLNEVMDRRTGLPITLSVVFLEVAQRVGLTAHGLNFPGHFLVAVRQPGGLVVLDPFRRGAVLTTDELRERWQRATQRVPPALKSLLAPARRLAIVVRILNNLKLVYLERDEEARAIAAVEKMVLVNPLGAEHHRELGALHLAAHQYSKAIDCLERYLQLAPDAADADTVRQHLRNATQMIARWN